MISFLVLLGKKAKMCALHCLASLSLSAFCIQQRFLNLFSKWPAKGWPGICPVL
jgi:hypothetical protein